MYRVYYSDNTREFYEDKITMHTFKRKEDALDCLVNYYIQFAIHNKSAITTDSGYSMYDYSTKEWTTVDYQFVQKYVKYI